MLFNIVNVVILLALCNSVASRAVPLAEATENQASSRGYSPSVDRLVQGLYGEAVSSIERRVPPIEPPRIPGSPKPGRPGEPGGPSAPKEPGSPGENVPGRNAPGRPEGPAPVPPPAPKPPLFVKPVGDMDATVMASFEEEFKAQIKVPQTKNWVFWSSSMVYNKIVPNFIKSKVGDANGDPAWFFDMYPRELIRDELQFGLSQENRWKAWAFPSNALAKQAVGDVTIVLPRLADFEHPYPTITNTKGVVQTKQSKWELFELFELTSPNSKVERIFRTDAEKWDGSGRSTADDRLVWKKGDRQLGSPPDFTTRPIGDAIGDYDAAAAGKILNPPASG